MILSQIEQHRIKRKWLLLTAAAVVSPWISEIGFSKERAAHVSNLAPFANASLPQELDLTISKCHDGDTCTGENAQKMHFTLRLLGIDSPEVSWAGKKGQMFGQESKVCTEALVKGKTFRVLLAERDRYNRFLALIIDRSLKNKSHSINERLIQEGCAFAYSGKNQKSEITDWSLPAQKEAETAKKGLWALKERPLDPKEFRKAK